MIGVMREMRWNRRPADTDRVHVLFVTGRHVADFDLGAVLAAGEITASSAFDPAIRRAAIARQGVPVVALLSELNDLVTAELDDLAARAARVRVGWLALLARLHDPVAAHTWNGVVLAAARDAASAIALLAVIAGPATVLARACLDRAARRTPAPGMVVSVVALLSRLHDPVAAHRWDGLALAVARD